MEKSLFSSNLIEREYYALMKQLKHVKSHGPFKVTIQQPRHPGRDCRDPEDMEVINNKNTLKSLDSRVRGNDTEQLPFK